MLIAKLVFGVDKVWISNLLFDDKNLTSWTNWNSHYIICWNWCKLMLIAKLQTKWLMQLCNSETWCTLMWCNLILLKYIYISYEIIVLFCHFVKVYFTFFLKDIGIFKINNNWQNTSPPWCKSTWCSLLVPVCHCFPFFFFFLSV